MIRLRQVNTLAEIEAAAERLSAKQKQELFLFLAAKVRAEGGKLPEPRKFSREEIDRWIDQDERDMADFREME